MNQQQTKPVCTKESFPEGNKHFKFSREMLRQLCLDFGADDAGSWTSPRKAWIVNGRASSGYIRMLGVSSPLYG